MRKIRIMVFSDNHETSYIAHYFREYLGEEVEVDLATVGEEDIGDKLHVFCADKKMQPDPRVADAIKDRFEKENFDAVVVAHYGGRGLHRLSLVPLQLLSRTIVVWSRATREKRAKYDQYRPYLKHFITRDALYRTLKEVIGI